ncbi:hypothetical protein LPC10_17770 [Methylorubrum sp. B1-46]|uniref:hypothetical protein n=1 Tax=Methylorubrum TaxID=2282523 RepID=UPI001E576798|nr:MULTISPECIES: hypothetical protein [Methylorubrum]MCG5246859.1 hypothetical protein [Methylorubrum extorquens]UGB24779.1 hypothetical protein LPC10_17770 [Methylorubrum sp. B1-46]
MRAVLTALALLAAGPALAGGGLREGIYCPVGVDLNPILVDGRGVAIDGLDCEGARFEGARLKAKACWTNGGHTVPYDVPIRMLADGSIEHDGARFRWHPAPPCPVQ